LHLFAKLKLALCAVLAGCASSQDVVAPSNSLREYEGNPRYTYNREIARSESMPLSKTYEQMTAAEKAELHKDLEITNPGDEPPFPMLGYSALVRQFLGDLEFVAIEDKGELAAIADVGADGKVVAVTIQKTPSRRVAAAATMALMKIKFKPAVCQGRVCAATFPVSLVVTRQ
jgi:hypothetical protein